MITIAPHHPLLPENTFGIEKLPDGQLTVNSSDYNSWQSFINNVSKRTIESIDFSNGSTWDLDENEKTSVLTSHTDDDVCSAVDNEKDSSTATCLPPTSSSSSSSSKVTADVSKEQLVNAQKHNRLMNNVRGKRKKGGQKLKERSILCEVKCSDGAIFTILSGVKGVLIEINEALLTQPNLLIEEVSFSFLYLFSP